MISWERLALNEDFRDLFTDQDDNPLTARIRALEADLVNLDITDPIKTMRIKAELHGIKFVERVVTDKTKARLAPQSAPNVWQTADSGQSHSPGVPQSRLSRWGLKGKVGA